MFVAELLLARGRTERAGPRALACFFFETGHNLFSYEKQLKNRRESRSLFVIFKTIHENKCLCKTVEVNEHKGGWSKLVHVGQMDHTPFFVLPGATVY